MNNIINEDVENIVSSGIKWDEFNQKTILILITNRNEGNLLERIQTMKL